MCNKIFETGKILCKNCGKQLFKYENGYESPESELVIDFKNVMIDKLIVSFDCCETSRQNLYFRCKECNTNGSVFMLGGGQELHIGISVYDENNKKIELKDNSFKENK